MCCLISNSGFRVGATVSKMDWFSRSPALISSSGVMHYPSDHISHAGALHLTRVCMEVMWGCWHRQAWRNSPRPTDRERHGERKGGEQAWNLTLRNTDLVSGFSYLVNLYVPASLTVMVPHKQRRSPVLFTGCEASTGKQILSALRNCSNNDDSLKKSWEGPGDGASVSLKYNLSCQKERL